MPLLFIWLTSTVNAFLFCVIQVALNWCICKGTVPIPGARTLEQAPMALDCLFVAGRLEDELVQCSRQDVAVFSSSFFEISSVQMFGIV